MEEAPTVVDLSSIFPGCLGAMGTLPCGRGSTPALAFSTRCTTNSTGRVRARQTTTRCSFMRGPPCKLANRQSCPQIIARSPELFIVERTLRLEIFTVRDAVSLGRLRHPLPTFAVGERSAQVASLNANVDCRQLPEHT